MAINKVVYGNNTLIDISDTTVAEGDVESGKTFYKNDGTQATGSYEWSWLGYKPEFVQQVYTEETALEDTLYATWTPSTTAKAIQATASVGTFSADLNNYEYLIRWTVSCTPVYVDGTVPKGTPYKECIVAYQHIFKRANSVTNIRNNVLAGNTCVTIYTTPLNVYYNTSGTITYTYSVSYGLYGALSAATFSSSTNNTPTVTVKKPTLNARCSTSYFTTTMAAAIDQTNTKFKMVGKLYRIPKGGVLNSLYQEINELYAEGLQ